MTEPQNRTLEQHGFSLVIPENIGLRASIGIWSEAQLRDHLAVGAPATYGSGSAAFDSPSGSGSTYDGGPGERNGSRSAP